jgi:hypothetical protein
MPCVEPQVVLARDRDILNLHSRAVEFALSRHASLTSEILDR